MLALLFKETERKRYEFGFRANYGRKSTINNLKKEMESPEKRL